MRKVVDQRTVPKGVDDRAAARELADLRDGRLVHDDVRKNSARDELGEPVEARAHGRRVRGVLLRFLVDRRRDRRGAVERPRGSLQPPEARILEQGNDGANVLRAVAPAHEDRVTAVDDRQSFDAYERDGLAARRDEIVLRA
jgi:hypothetical protein